MESLLGPADKINVASPALRSKLECQPIDTTNVSAWLDVLEFHDRSLWNDPNIPSGLEFGWELKAGLSLNESLGGGKYKYWDDEHPYFSFFANDAKVQCCGNESNGILGEAAVGYWSPSADEPQFGIVVKWVTGHAFPKTFTDSNNHQHWVWGSLPQLTALNCTPAFETANARVEIDPATGIVQAFSLTSQPVADSNAWSYNYEASNVSQIPSAQNISIRYDFFLLVLECIDTSSSYGYLFHDVLLGAADSARVGKDQKTTNQTEDLSDDTYNFRSPGINLDFMSYVSLALVQNNNSALLDPTILANVSSTVFSKFFQHFIGASVPSTDGLYMDGSWGLQPSAKGTITQATISVPTEELDFNTTAATVSLTILVFLLLTTLIIAGFQRRYLKLLPRDVDTLGSILGFVYASERLLGFAAESNNLFSEKGEAAGEMTKMGWFNSGGRRHWGIEIVNHRDVSQPPMEEIPRDSLDQEIRPTSFDTLEAIAERALRTPPRPSSRFHY
jgi:hypothetical protein